MTAISRLTSVHQQLPVLAKQHQAVSTVRFEGDLPDQITAKPIEVDPTPLPRWARFVAKVINPFILRQRENIRAKNIEVHGLENLRNVLDDRRVKVIVTPNHPGSGDINLINHMFGQLDAPFQCMATIATFNLMPKWVSSLWQWALRRNGVFPIHMDAKDKTAFNLMYRLLRDDVHPVGDFPLVVYPEAGRTFKSDVVDPLQPGIIRGGLTNALRMATVGEKQDKRIATQGYESVIVPVGVNYYYPDNLLSYLRKPVEKLETHYGIAHTPGENGDLIPLVNRTEALWHATLKNKAETLLGRNDLQHEDLGTHIMAVADALMAHVEGNINIVAPAPAPETVQDQLNRYQSIREVIYERLHPKSLKKDEPDPPPPPQSEQKAYLKHCETLEVAYLVLRYSANYLRTTKQPRRIQKRLMESLHKLEELAYGNSSLIQSRDRHAVVNIGKPISLKPHLEAAQKTTTRNPAIAAITQQVHASLQQLVLDTPD